MLRIHDDMLSAISMLCPFVAKIHAHDRGLATQLREAASSVALNISEGSGGRGGTRRERYSTALGSARETMSCLAVASRWGYVGPASDELTRTMNRVIGTLVRVTR